MIDWRFDRIGVVDNDGWVYVNDFYMFKGWLLIIGSSFEKGFMFV